MTTRTTLQPVRVTAETRARLAAIAATEGRSESWVLLAAVQEFLAAHPNGQLNDSPAERRTRAAAIESLRKDTT
jgi:predicted transcriptional regulator